MQDGISKISAEEAKKLPVPTLTIPGTNDYLVQLDVFHELHCLNDLRKLLYPERFHMMEGITSPNGTVDRDNNGFRHWGKLPTLPTLPIYFPKNLSLGEKPTPTNF